jgi:hypothetical protein
MRVLLLSATLLLALAAPARADVLVNSPKPVIHCGKPIRLGVWYRDFPTKGHREVTVDVRSARGTLVFHRRLQAPSAWKFWNYEPRCGRHYRVRYTTSDGPIDFRVWVRRD